MLEFALCYDQVNASELASFELALRRAQISELKYKQKMLGTHHDEHGQDEFLYLGVGATRGLVMVAPDLEEFVSSEMAKEGSVMKERRKLHEERRLARGGKERGRGDRGRGRGRGDKGDE